MTQFYITREDLLKPLQMVSNVTEKKQTLPILSHLLFSVQNEQLSLKGTDLEISIESFAPLKQLSQQEKKLTLPARKLLDICRNLPPESTLEFTEENHRCLIRSGASQFSLSTLPAADFPEFNQTQQDYTEICIKQKNLLRLIHATGFAIAQRDVRYFLNGMLWEISPEQLTFVATDGHRLAFNQYRQPSTAQEKISVIIPRKCVTELTRLLSGQADDSEIKILINAHHIVVKGSDFNFISRLIEGEFPNYEHVIPKQVDKTINLDRQSLKQALIRTSILSNEKLPGISMQLRKNNLCLLAKNPEKEEAKEEMIIDYLYDDMNIGCNSAYLIDALNALQSTSVSILLHNASTAFIVKEGEDIANWSTIFVIMPMRL